MGVIGQRTREMSNQLIYAAKHGLGGQNDQEEDVGVKQQWRSGDRFEIKSGWGWRDEQRSRADDRRRG